MTNCIQFIDMEYSHVVTVTYELGDDIEEIAKFEARRIQSLQERKIKVRSETRYWDDARNISIRMYETDHPENDK